MPAGKKKDMDVSVLEVSRGKVTFCIRGVTPLIMNAMSAKVKQGLLLGTKRKSKSEKESTVKHVPIEEYRSSIYRARGDDVPTRIIVRSESFKSAFCDVAVDMPGAAKTQIGRLSYVEGADYKDSISVYGIPQLRMDVTRMADINRTPDVRTRAILPEWACYVSVTFTRPLLNETQVAKLMAAAGIMRGIGDFRVQKGKGDYGQFELVDENDAVFQRILKEGGREAQDAALENPAYYDHETQELMEWYAEECKNRGFAEVV